MKRCLCGRDNFNVVMSICAVVVDHEDNSVEIVQHDPIHPVKEITGDILCSCGTCYEKWDNIPDAPEEEED